MFTHDSIKIIEYLFNKNYENNNYKDELEGIDKCLFRKLFTFLRKVDNDKFDSNKIYDDLKKEITIHDFSLNKYIASDVRHYIETKINTRYDYVLQIDNKTINICLRTHGEIPPKKLKVMLQRIIYAIGITVNLSEPPKTIDMVIYLTPFKKKIDGMRRREAFLPDEINSGSTLCSPQPHVIISREEEFFKVVIHELIHAMNYDVKSDVDVISQIIKDITNIDLPFNHYEAYTEFWANMLNAYFMANIMTVDTPSYTFNLFIELVNYERLWALFQCSKVLYLTDCQIEPHLKYKDLCKLNLNTNVYAYFILRSFMMFNINTFMSDMMHKNKNIIDLNNNIQYYNEYVLDLVKKTIYNEKYKLLLKKNINDLVEIKKNKLLQFTLRMSVCEFKLH